MKKKKGKASLLTNRERSVSQQNGKECFLNFFLGGGGWGGEERVLLLDS